MLLSLEIGCLCVNRLRVHTVASEGQTQWVFMLSCYARMQRLRLLDLQSDTEQKTDPAFALHLHLNWVAYRNIRSCFPVYLVFCII